MQLTSRRLGRFEITLETIEKEPHLARLIMAQVIVINAEGYYHSGAAYAVRYVALCDAFEETPPDFNVPFYMPVLRAGDFSHWEKMPPESIGV